jgi:2-dehydropantoate 2-reductase
MGFRIAIVGSGAIGSYYGAKLAHAGSDVHFLMRGDLKDVRRDGLHIRGPGEDIHVARVNCYGSTTEIGPCDLVVVALKATSNAELAGLIPPLLQKRTMLLTLQNGLGNDEFLGQHFGAYRVLGGLCFICLSRISRTKIERYDYGHIVLGEFERKPQPRTHKVAATFREAGVACEVTDDLACERWRKLVWNIPFNGLSILAGGVNTSQILGDDSLRETTFSLMGEVIDGANRCGHALPADAAAEQIARTEKMDPYKPSTLIDWETGRSLEIEAIWGEPLRRATAAGAKMPRTQIVYALLKKLDGGRSRVSNLTALSGQVLRRR